MKHLLYDIKYTKYTGYGDDVNRSVEIRAKKDDF